MHQLRKSTVEPLQIELLDGSTVLLRANAWIFKQHFRGLRSAETADLSQLDAMLEFIYDCVLDKDAMPKERFMQAMPFDMGWISELFTALISAASPDRPTPGPVEVKNSTGSNI